MNTGSNQPAKGRLSVYEHLKRTERERSYRYLRSLLEAKKPVTIKLDGGIPRCFRV
jgi:hypothetical protein